MTKEHYTLRMMELHNSWWRSLWTMFGALDLELNFWNEKNLREVNTSKWWSVRPCMEGVFGMESSSRRERSSGRRDVISGRLFVAEAPWWTLRVVDVSGEALGNLDACHHLDASQILTTTTFK